MPGSYGGAGGGGLSAGPNPYDAVRTFSESGVTVSFDGSKISDTGGQLSLDESTTTDSPTGSYTQYTNNYSTATEFEALTDAYKFDVTLSSKLGSVSSVFVVDTNENLLAEDTSGHTGGDVVTFDLSLTAGTRYIVGVWDGGGSYNFVRSDVAFPVAGTNVDFTDGYKHAHPDDGSTKNSRTYCYAITDLTTHEYVPSGQATVEWSGTPPADIYAWDVATFTRTEDGATVSVYIEVSDDGGATWNKANGGNPITRNYSLSGDTAVTPSHDVRFVVDLSRTGPSQNPTIDSLIRSWYL